MNILHVLLSIPIWIYLIIGVVLIFFGGIGTGPRSDFPELGWGIIFAGVIIISLGIGPEIYLKNNFPLEPEKEYSFKEDWNDPYLEPITVKIISFKDGYVKYTLHQKNYSHKRKWFLKRIRNK